MTESAAIEAGVALLLALVVWIIANTTRVTLAIGTLLLLIPFQFVQTRFTSSSVLMTYGLFLILMIRQQVEPRETWLILAIFAAYCVSIAFASQGTLMLHMLYTLNFMSCFVVFLLAFKYGKNVASPHSVVDLLLAINLLVILYCGLQLFAGAGNSFKPFGLDFLSFNANRHAGDPRLVGPFNSPGVTSTYLAIMSVVCMSTIMVSQGRRRLLAFCIVLANVIGIIATANRGAFILLVVCFPFVIYFFRRELGPSRAAIVSLGGVLTLVIAAAVVINFTEFDRLFDRLGDVTETADGLPKNRAETWSSNLELIRNRPLVGDGPRFIDPEVAESLGQLRTLYERYPHNLYIFMIRTVGVLGLAALLCFFLSVWTKIIQGYRQIGWRQDETGLIRAGVIFVPFFMLDQIRLEFNRYDWLDFAQFVLMMFGLFAAIASRGSKIQPVRSV